MFEGLAEKGKAGGHTAADDRIDLEAMMGGNMADLINGGGMGDMAELMREIDKM